MLDVVVQQSQHVSYLMHGQLLQADSAVVCRVAADCRAPPGVDQLLVAAIIFVVVEVDVAGGPRVRQLSAESVERLVAVHVVPCNVDRENRQNFRSSPKAE